jgi:5-methylcytosine-specific restriction endonuclease McrA
MSASIVSYAGRERARRELQNDIIFELERAGAPVATIHYTLTVLLPHSGLTWAQVAQRVRRAKEKRARIAYQNSQKPKLYSRCISSFKATCTYCDRPGTAEADPDGKRWELDRIFPGRLGGEYEPSNVALACHACNRKKGGTFTALPPPSLADVEAA